MRLQGKQAFVTGSSRGIGRGIALKLAREGATIAVHYRRDHEAAAETLAEVRELGADGVIVQGDVTSVDDLRRMFAELRDTFGTLDIFVSNARGELPMSELQEAASLMQSGGRIVAITCAGRAGHSEPQPAEAPRIAPENACRAFAIEVAPRGITVNAVCPGLTEDTPMGRLGTPEDIGNVVALLCAEEASWITGQLISADGGASLKDPLLRLDGQQPEATSVSPSSGRST